MRKLIGLILVGFTALVFAYTPPADKLPVVNDAIAKMNLSVFGGGVPVVAAGLSGDYFTCDFSGTTAWDNEGDCGGSNEFDSVTGTPTFSAGAGVAAAAHNGTTYGVATWVNTDNYTTHYKFKFKTDEINGNDAADWTRPIHFMDGGTATCSLDLSVSSGGDAGKFRVSCADVGGDTTGWTSIAISENTDYWIGVSMLQDTSAGWVKIWISTDESLDSGDRRLYETGLDTSNGGKEINYIRFGISYNNSDTTVTFTVDDLEVDDDTSYGADP